MLWALRRGAGNGKARRARTGDSSPLHGLLNLRGAKAQQGQELRVHQVLVSVNGQVELDVRLRRAVTDGVRGGGAEGGLTAEG